MAEISKINTNNTTYDIKDSTSRAALAEVVDAGAKNLVDFSNYSTSNLSFVTESNGVVTVNGTSTTTYTIFSNVQLKAGAYIISGCPSGGGSSTYSIDLRTIEGAQIPNTTDTGSGSPIITINNTGTYRLSIRIAANYAATNITFYPMICSKPAWDASQKYVPYAPTNKELYESKVDKARPSISSNSNLNDYKQVGHFKVTSSSVASSIANTPFTASGYILDVDYWYQVLSDTTGCIQTAMANVANTLIEKKRIYQYQNGAWSWTPWVTIYSISIPT
jgi:hypothetical protein